MFYNLIKISPNESTQVVENKNELCITNIGEQSLIDVFKQHQVSGVYLLKLETKYCDTILLDNYLNECDNKLLPHKIHFKPEHPSDHQKVIDLLNKCKRKGYELIKYTKNVAAELELNINLIKNRGTFTQFIDGYYLAEYPKKYDPANPPHLNTLKDAMDYCQKNQYGGVTYESKKYQVRLGNKLIKTPNSNESKSIIYV